MAHKLKTERVNAGVIAECTGEGCTWSGNYSSTKSPVSIKELRTMTPEQRAQVTPIKVEDQVFPNRNLAVEAHRAFHSAKD
jgi:hypothetical protein